MELTYQEFGSISVAGLFNLLSQPWKETNDLWAATSILALKPTAISVNYSTNSLPI